MENYIQSVTKNFKNQKVLIAGETFLDTYIHGFSQRISREAPVPIVDVAKKVYVPGGAANTAMNVAALSGKALFLSAVGNDDQGNIATDILREKKVNVSFVIMDNKRKTIEKNRIIVDGQIMFRYDIGSCGLMTGTVEEKYIHSLIEEWGDADAVIISDYGYGIITDMVIQTIQALQKKMPRLLLIDSKYLDRFKTLQATVVKPNYVETLMLLGITRPERGERRVSQIRAYKDELFERTNASIVAVTLDADGALIFDRNGLTYRTYAQQVNYPKGVGAGDTYVATLALALAASADIKTAAEIAAQATKIIITKQGTAVCTFSELETLLVKNDKYIDQIATIEQIVQMHKRQGKKIVCTNGCFDILHSGHINYLQQAKSYGDILLVGVNTDESIHKIKGPYRPINTLHDRVNVLSALSCVDYIVPIPEETGCTFVEMIKPDIYIKGSDYTLETLPEAQVVTKYGGKIIFVPLIKGKSTTSIINRIQQFQNQSP